MKQPLMGIILIAVMFLFTLAVVSQPRTTGWAHIVRAPCHAGIAVYSNHIDIICPDGHIWEYLK